VFVYVFSDLRNWYLGLRAIGHFLHFFLLSPSSFYERKMDKGKKKEKKKG